MGLDNIVKNKLLSIDNNLQQGYKYCCTFKTRKDSFFSMVFLALCNVCDDYNDIPEDSEYLLDTISRYIEFCQIQHLESNYVSVVKFIMINYDSIKELYSHAGSSEPLYYEDPYVLSAMIHKTVYSVCDICCYCQSVNDVQNLDFIDYMYAYLLSSLECVSDIFNTKRNLISEVNLNGTISEFFDQVDKLLKLQITNISDEETAAYALLYIRRIKEWD